MCRRKSSTVSDNSWATTPLRASMLPPPGRGRCWPRPRLSAKSRCACGACSLRRGFSRPVPDVYPMRAPVLAPLELETGDAGDNLVPIAGVSAHFQVRLHWRQRSDQLPDELLDHPRVRKLAFRPGIADRKGVVHADM